MISSIDIIIALGGNLPSSYGRPIETLSAALRLLERRGAAVKRRSRWWRTPAFPPGSGPEFINGAASLETCLDPEELLAALHEVEAEIGRVRSERWGARPVDLDLIAYGDATLPDSETVKSWMTRAADPSTPAPERLILPHPRLQERGFVLAPMNDVAPGWRHPVLDLTTAEMLARLPAPSLEDVRPIED